MKKKIVACLLAFTLLLLPSCGKAEKGSVRRNRDVLTVCIDSALGDTFIKGVLYDFMYTFRNVTGIEDVEFEYLPESGVKRETMIQRMRTELMSGAGPDVFLVQCAAADRALFPYPQKVMEAGFFLPLDDYMENHTQYTEWDRQQPVVLAAGRNDEGQQIIPLYYTAPVQVHDKARLDIETPDHPLTFDEALNDPELYPYYSEFYNCQNIYLSDGEEFYSVWPGLLQYILGQTADFEAEELLFTEEELLATVEKIYSLPFDKALHGVEYKEDGALVRLPSYAQPFTLLPLYSADGGVTVEVDSFAAINRNTKRPEEAYVFLDYFMREKTQLTSSVYQNFTFEGIPLFDDAFKEGFAYKGQTLTEEAYAEFKDYKAQITAVNFTDDFSKDLALMMTDCWTASKNGLPFDEIVHEAYELMERKVRE